MKESKLKVAKLWGHDDPEDYIEVNSIEEIPPPIPQYHYVVITAVLDGKIVDSVFSSSRNFASNKRIDKMEANYPDCEVWTEKFFSKKQASERSTELKKLKNEIYDFGI